MTAWGRRSLLAGVMLLGAAPRAWGADNLWSPLGLFGGPVQALATRPGDGQVVYAGTMDGVFRSLDGGAAWTASGLAGRVVQSLAVDPERPLYLLAGTDAGLFRSLDGGSTWSSGEELGPLSVAALAIDPRDTLRAYAGTDAGFLSTTDGGLTWDSSSQGLVGPVRALAVEAADTLRLYAGTEAGVFVSEDRGQTWTDAGEGLDGAGVSVLAVDGGLAWVYAGTGAGLFRSSDRGANWEPAGEGFPLSAVEALAVDPSDDLRVYAGGGSGVFRSLDGGTSWTFLDDGLPAVPVRALWLDSLDGSRLYAGTRAGVFRLDGGTSWKEANTGLSALSVRALAVDPSDALRLYAGGESGIFRSLDGGASWTRSQAELDVHALLVDPGSPLRVFAGTHAGVFRSLDGGSIWSSAAGALDTLSVQALAAGAAGTALLAGTEKGVFRSLDGGLSWSSGSQGLAALSVRALALDPGGEWVFAGTEEGVYRSGDGGSSWTPSSAGMGGLAVRALALDGAGRAVFAGTDGGIFRSLDDGLTWEGINAGLTTSSIRALAVDPADSLHLYAGTRGGVFRSLDRGDTWQPIEPGLTHPYVLTVAMGPSRPRHVYAGTVGGGVFGIILTRFKIVLHASPASIRANGEDRSILTAVVQDSLGGRLRTDNSTEVTFAIVEGPEDLGDLEVSRAVVVEGLARVSFTAGTLPGIATVKAAAPGLQSDSVSIVMSQLIPEIGLSSDRVDFGISGEPVHRELTLYNRGEVDLVINQLITTKPEFEVESPDPGISISPGDSLVMELKFDPSTTFPSIEAALVLTTNDPNAPVIIVDLKAGSQKPQIQVSVSDTLFFGEVAVTKSGEKSLVVENSGTGLLGVGAATTDEQFQVSPESFDLEPGRDTTVVITFRPRDASTVEASLGLTSNDPDNSFLDLPLRGRGIKPRLEVEPRLVELGEVRADQAVPVILTLANAGEAELVIEGFLWDGEPMEALEDRFPWPLEPGERSEITIRVSPPRLGPVVSILTIDSNDPDQPTIQVSFTLTGVAPVLEVLADTLDFGGVSVGDSLWKALPVHNRGDARLNLDPPTVEETRQFAAELSSLSLAPGDTAEVWILFRSAIDGGPSGKSEKIQEILSLSGDGGTRTVILTAQVIDEQIAVYNYPNPVPRGQPTTFWFSGSGRAEIRIFNTAGELVERLTAGPESRTLAWDGTDRGGRLVSPGLYVCVYLEDGELRQRQLLQVIPASRE